MAPKHLHLFLRISLFFFPFLSLSLWLDWLSCTQPSDACEPVREDRLPYSRARARARTHTHTHTHTHRHTHTLSDWIMHRCKLSSTYSHTHSTLNTHTHTHTHPSQQQVSYSSLNMKRCVWCYVNFMSFCVVLRILWGCCSLWKHPPCCYLKCIIAVLCFASFCKDACITGAHTRPLQWGFFLSSFLLCQRFHCPKK